MNIKFFKKSLKSIAILASLCTAMAAPSLQAQTPVTFTNFGPGTTGPLTGNLNLEFIPVTANGGPAQVWIEAFYNPTQYNPGYNSVAFYGDASSLGVAHVTKVEENGVSVFGKTSISGITLAPKVLGAKSAESTVVVYFNGTSTDGFLYSGIVKIDVHTSYAYHSGRDAAYFWTITPDSGLVDVTFVQQASTSPIAPTPNPPGMPPTAVKRTAEFHLATRQIPQLLRVQNYSGPPSGCYDYTPIAGPYPCLCGGRGCSQCMTWRAMCTQQGSEYGFEYPYYWTQIYG